MSRKLITSAADLKGIKPGAAELFAMRATSIAPDLSNDNGRIITYIFSDDSVARDGHTIASDGWQLAAFRENPVFLFAHDQDQPPIGRVVDVGPTGGKLRGAVEYLDRDIYPFADTIFQMVKRGFLNAVSVSWLPIDWKFSKDKSRQGGIDFLKQELLEVSQVPVPALATALVQARAAGLDTSPFVGWAEKVLDGGGMVMVPRAQLEALRRDAKMPAAAKPKATVLTSKSTVRGLYTVANVSDILSYLMSQVAQVEWETAVEEDDSDVGPRLLEVAKTLGQLLVDMTIEEVNELFATGEEGEADTVFIEVLSASAKTPAQRALLKLGMLARKMKEAEDAPEAVTLAQVDERIKSAISAVATRAGKVLSKGNLESLNTALEHHAETERCIRSVIDSATPAEDQSAETERAAKEAASRARKAKALKLKAA